MREHSFKEKLAAYTVMSAAFLAACHENADAQIVYHDIIPDDTLNATSTYNDMWYYLDLNNDAVYDFKFRYSGNAFYDEVAAWPENNFLWSDNPVNYGYPIDNNIGFDANGHGLAFLTCTTFSSSNTWCTQTGPWMNTADKYLPFEINNAGIINYGWLRLDVNTPEATMVVKDFAINMTPNVTINAGDKGCLSIPSIPVITSAGADSLTSSSAVNFQWFYNGNMISGDTAQIISQIQNGIYSVITTDINGCFTQSNIYQFGNCDSIGFYISTNDPLVACDSPFVLLINPVNVPIGNYYNWYNNFYQNGYYFNSVQTNLTYLNSYIPPFMQYSDSSDIYSITINPITGCSDTSNHIQFSFAIPSVQISQHSDSLICLPNGPYTYYWYKLNGSNSVLTDSTNVNFYLPDTSGNYYVKIYDSAGCNMPSSSIHYNDCYFIDQVLTFNYPCYGDTAIISAHDYLGFHYNWFLNNSGVYYGFSHTYNATIPGTYKVMIIEPGYSCYATSNNIVIPPPPQQPNFLNATYYALGCDVDSISLFALLTNGIQYEWHDANGIINSATNSPLIITTPGIYWVVMYDSTLNCTITSNQVNITSPAPYPTSIVTQWGYHLQSNNNQQYQWYLDGNPITGATNQNYTPIITGNYSVEGTNQYGCSTMSDLVYFELVSVNPVDDVSGIQLLIDPKFLQVIFSNEKFIGSQLQLYNSTGQLVNEIIATEKTESINIESLAKGIYILNIRNGNAIKNYKIAIL